MHIGIYTVDEMNSHRAVLLGAKFGATVELAYPKDEPPEKRYDAVIYDLDHWPAEEGRRVIASLMKRLPPYCVAVIKYWLPRRVVRRCRRRGVVVCRHLDQGTIRKLFREANKRTVLTAAECVRCGEKCNGKFDRIPSSPGI
jgi:hypothetical protein